MLGREPLGVDIVFSSRTPTEEDFKLVSDAIATDKARRRKAEERKAKRGLTKAKRPTRPAA